MQILRIITLGVVFLYASYSVHSQVNYIEVYYPIINRAELAIVDSNYKKALATFDSAFHKVPKPFAKDYFNALVCAVHLKQNKKAYQICDSLISLGVSKEFLEFHPGLELLRETKSWNKYLATYEKKFKIGAAQRPMAYLSDTLINRDQKFRRMKGSYRVYQDTINYWDSLNILQLKELIATTGFPNERMVDHGNPTKVDFPGLIVLIHNAEGLSLKHKLNYDFFHEFIDAVRKGELSPNQFAYLNSLQNNQEVNLEGMPIIFAQFGSQISKPLHVKYTTDNQRRIDERRNAYGICSLADYFRKALFSFNNSRSENFAFAPYGQKNIWDLGSKEEYDKWVNDMSEME